MPATNRTERAPVLLRFAPVVGTSWHMEGRSRMDFGMGAMDATIRCITTVRSAEGGVYELSTTGCETAMDNAPVVGAPHATLPDALEQYDAFGGSLPDPGAHRRRGHPTLVTFPVAPVREGDRWSTPPALALAGTGSELFPPTLEYVLEQLDGSTASIGSHASYSGTSGVLATLDVRGVIDLETGVFLSYEMMLVMRDPSDPSSPSATIAYELTTTWLR